MSSSNANTSYRGRPAHLHEDRAGYARFEAPGHVKQTLIHTRQHYDRLLSDNFFHDLELPEAHVNLGIESAAQALETRRVMRSVEASDTATI